MNATRAVFNCYSYAWLEILENGTDLLRSPGNLLLNAVEPTLEAATGSKVELIHAGSVSHLYKNTTSFPVLNALWSGLADVNFDLWSFRWDRHQLVDFLHPFRV